MLVGLFVVLFVQQLKVHAFNVHIRIVEHRFTYVELQINPFVHEDVHSNLNIEGFPNERTFVC